MRPARLLTGTALVVAAGFAAAPAYGADAGSLEVYPAAVAPGAEVTVNTAGCGADESVSGDAGAVGAGDFAVTPSQHEGDAVGQFTVPPSAQPGTYEIVARCSGGKRLAGDLVVTLTSGRETPGAARTGGAGETSGTKESRKPAEPRASDGSRAADGPRESGGPGRTGEETRPGTAPEAGTTGRTDGSVGPVGSTAPGGVHPKGSVKTGVGGALGPDPVQTAAGVAALAVAAAGGTWLLHRRARGDGI
ncbi:hypothetical protein AB0F07_03110 [Streptomyces fructofermentans]|uniref:hypothetical protein n=1 Tax=Streptomyces fructofermentans TaxID=152141 RepID=UPI0033D3BA65